MHLHVKNLALIQEVQADFGPGLNILTGETGAGKSILLGSVNLALGQKMTRGMIREGADYALVELVFQVKSHTEEKLKEMDVYPEDGQVIITRRLMENRSISKVNGETSTAANVRKIAALLLDIHGQHEHQSLLYPEKQMEILDAFGNQEISAAKNEVAELYKKYSGLKKELEGYEMDEEQRRREIGFLEYEIQEISQAQLCSGEDEELETSYRKLANGKRITEGLGYVYQLTGYEGEGMGALMGRAVQKLAQIREYDPQLENIYSSVEDIDSLLNDLNREISSYLSEFTFSEEEFGKIENRLDLINHLKSKYGHTIEKILAYQKEKELELEKLENFQTRKEELERQLKDQEDLLEEASGSLTEIRKKWAGELEKKIVQGLQDLNFLNVEFYISFKEKETFTAQGKDSISFMISTNPGEPVLPLQKVVSGGELSRIMLAIKTLLADKDQTETLIFDEIDTGISGRTAQKVSEKLKEISRTHQVICITHLPQIASMADCHFEIEKSVREGKTVTQICRLGQEESIRELARLLGGAQITDAVLKNAREMKELAERSK